MNKTNRILDKYDSLLIRLFKSHRRHSQRFIYYVKRIWGIRCALDPQYVDISFVVDHLLELGFDLGIIHDHNICDLIKAANPKEMWRFVALQQKPEDFKDYYECWLVALASHFALTEVKDLTGYRNSAYWRKQLDKTDVSY